MDSEYQIIGMGLAGASLAWHLLDEGCDVTVVDRAMPGASTRVAAGLFTPVTGKRMAMVWQGDRVFQYAKLFFEEVEAATGRQFYHEQPAWRIFDSAEEREAWAARRERPDLQAYVEREVALVEGPGLRENAGGLLLRGSGWVDLPVFLEAVRERFERLGMMREEPGRARNTLYCEGHWISENPLFSFLPFRMNKGDILEVNFHASIGDKILHRGVYVLPLSALSPLSLSSRSEGDGFPARVGGAFLRDYAHRDPDLNTRREIEAGIARVLDIPFEVTGHVSGIRPSTTHFRPVLGMHPEVKGVGVFNSLGSKGVVFGPYFGRQLCRHLVHGEELDREVDVRTYWEKYA